MSMVGLFIACLGVGITFYITHKIGYAIGVVGILTGICGGIICFVGLINQMISDRKETKNLGTK